MTRIIITISENSNGNVDARISKDSSTVLLDREKKLSDHLHREIQNQLSEYGLFTYSFEYP